MRSSQRDELLIRRSEFCGCEWPVVVDSPSIPMQMKITVSILMLIPLLLIASSRAEFPPTTRAATQNAPFVNSLGMKFVPVKIFGGPTKRKRILFCIWDTRVQDYAEYAKAKGIVSQKPKFPQDSTHPVVNVTRDEAEAFCDWLTATERTARMIGEKDVYRLPSDHEWSCAAGIGRQENPEESPQKKTGKIPGFPWGFTWPPPKGSGNIDPRGLADDFEYTSPVASFPGNANGLYDMAGNVSQWCGDRFGNNSFAVLRGGSWQHYAAGELQTSRRFFYGSSAKADWIGFRCILEVSQY